LADKKYQFFMDDKAFLGTGWSFPPAFDRKLKSVGMVSGVEDINESLDILLSTSLGERVMQPRYGANLKDYQFEGLNPTMISYLRDLIERAILFYEPRIRVDKVSVSEKDTFDLLEGRLIIEIDYTISAVNTRFNYVYDFYLREANRSI
jgi:hypothetical protein